MVKKSNCPFLFFVYIALKIYIILLQILFHKNILLYKSVCINIRGVASCRRNILNNLKCINLNINE